MRAELHDPRTPSAEALVKSSETGVIRFFSWLCPYCKELGHAESWVRDALLKICPDPAAFRAAEDAALAECFRESISNHLRTNHG